MKRPLTEALVEQGRAAIDAALADASNVDLSWIQPPPMDDGWTLAPDALRFLTSLAMHLRPSHVLEFGSGLSTRVLARACDGRQPVCAISSVDHDPRYSAEAAEHFAAPSERGCRVRFLVAPLVLRRCGGKLLPQYHLQPGELASRAPVDLGLIDGPPLMLGGREGVLYQAMEFARPGTVLLLDDADRASEREVLACWQGSLGDSIEVIALPGASGLAAVLVRRPVRPAELWAHRTRLTAQDIERLVPTGQSLILVDLDYWGGTLVPGRRVIPFLERDGKHWGSPADETIALRELERLRDAGADHIVFVWPAYWWFDRYPQLMTHIRSRHRCLLENDRLCVFDLRSRP